MRFLIISKRMVAIISILLALLIVASIFLTISNKSKEVFYEDIYYKGTKILIGEMSIFKKC